MYFYSTFYNGGYNQFKLNKKKNNDTTHGDALSMSCKDGETYFFVFWRNKPEEEK